MKNKILKVAIVLLFVFSIFNFPFQSLNALSSNYSLIYFETPSEVQNFISNGFVVEELYSDSMLCNITEAQEEWLTDNEVFYQSLGDITKFHVQNYEFASNDKKEILYPSDLNKELFSISPSDKSIKVVQFIGPVKKEWKEILLNYNMPLYFQYDSFAYLTTGRDIDLVSLRNLSFVRSAGGFPPSLKVSEDVLRSDFDLVDLEVVLTSDFDYRSFEKEFNHPAGKTQFSHVEGEFYLRLFDVSKKKLPILTFMDSVVHVYLYENMEPQNAEAAKVSSIRDQAGNNILTNDLPGGLTGLGEICGVADTGLSTGNPATIHPAFTQPTFYDKVLGTFPIGDWADTHGHGTHVAGTVLGTGASHNSGTLRFRGMAPDSKLVFQDFLDHQPLYNPIPTLFDEAYANGVKVHNNSWGSADFYGTYDSRAADCDMWAWDHKDAVIVKSAGNDRDDWYWYFGDPFHRSLGGISAAKNFFVIGANQNDYPTDPHPCYYHRMAAFSSIGPCHDGRIKPDVIAPGAWLVSCKINTGYTNEDANYYIWQGTSMSAPVVTGSLALVRQYYRDVMGMNPSDILASLLKATIINGCVTDGLHDASDYSSYYPSSNDHITVPGPICGWGRVNVQNSLYPSSGDWYSYVNNAGLNEGQQDVYYVEVTDSSTPLKVTLAWTDYPGTPKSSVSTEPDLINNLNLQVFSYTDQERYRGNQLYSYNQHNFHNGEQFASIPKIIAVDTINNVEVVNIPVPSPGVYQIVVRADGDNYTQQSYSMVASGDMFQTVEPNPTPPTNPSGLKANTTCEGVELSWNPSHPGDHYVKEYVIKRMFAGTGIPVTIGTVDASTTTFFDSTAVYNRRFNYYVFAVDTEGNYSMPSNIITAGEAVAPSNSFIWANPDPNFVVVHWSHARPGTCPVEQYKVYRACSVSCGNVPVATLDASKRTWADTNVEPGNTYCYYVVAVDSKGLESMASNITQVVIPIGEEDVRVSAETNQDSYAQNDTIIMKVQLVNVGRVDCPNEKLIVTLPEGINYSSADKLEGTVGNNGAITFDIGPLNKGTQYYFTMFLTVELDVSRDQVVYALLQAYCGTNYQSEKKMSLLLRPAKNQNKHLDPTIRLGGTSQDPDTGKATINQNEVLSLQMSIRGGTPAYTLTIDWGDTSDILTEQNIPSGKELSFEHTFEAKGSVTIRIVITDSMGRRRVTTIDVEVK